MPLPQVTPLAYLGRAESHTSALWEMHRERISGKASKRAAKWKKVSARQYLAKT